MIESKEKGGDHRPARRDDERSAPRRNRKCQPLYRSPAQGGTREEQRGSSRERSRELDDHLTYLRAVADSRKLDLASSENGYLVNELAQQDIR